MDTHLHSVDSYRHGTVRQKNSISITAPNFLSKDYEKVGAFRHCLRRDKHSKIEKLEWEAGRAASDRKVGAAQ